MTRDEALAELKRANANMEAMERDLYLRLQAVEDERDALKQLVVELEREVRSLRTYDREDLL